MIWIKRILPFILLAGLYFGNSYYQDTQKEKKIADEKRYALITAIAWVGSMTHRDDPEAYLTFRDSLLEANNLSNDSLKMFVEGYRDKAEYLAKMASYIKLDVDSILHVADSLKADSLRLDSLEQVADSLAVDSLETDK